MNIVTRVRAAVAATAVLFASVGASYAATVDIIGGETTLLMTSIGLDVSPTGTATSEFTEIGTLISFQITGGSYDTDTGEAIVEHIGSGINFADASQSITFQDFIVDTALSSVFSDIAGGASGVLAFTFGEAWDDGRIPLIASSTFSDFFVTSLNLKVALAEITPEVPLPAAGFLMLAGLGSFAAFGRRKTA